MTDIRPLLTPEFRATITAIAARDEAEARARRDEDYARQHREAGNHKLAAMYLECAADGRDELARMLAEARGIARDGTPTTETQRALVAMMEE